MTNICKYCKAEINDNCGDCGKPLKGKNLMCGSAMAYHCVNCYFKNEENK